MTSLDTNNPCCYAGDDKNCYSTLHGLMVMLMALGIMLRFLIQESYVYNCYTNLIILHNDIHIERLHVTSRMRRLFKTCGKNVCFAIGTQVICQ